MYATIKKTASQFAFNPKIINSQNLKPSSSYIVVGMGGSQLAAGLLKMWSPELDLIIHRNYGLPQLPLVNLRQRLIIFSSYSGNTEEVLDAYRQAGEMKLNRAVITIGGQLLELAKKDGVAYIQMPDFDIQPRSALPLSLKSILCLTGQKSMLLAVNKLQSDFHPENFETAGKSLATDLHDRTPIIYSAAQNDILAYIWKITFNETAKIPAFENIFPEVNHNEMIGFDINQKTDQLSQNFYFLFLSDPDDDPKIKSRMAITAKLYQDRGLPSKIINLGGGGNFLKIFNSLALVNFVAYFIAKNYGLESEKIPMIEEFKKMIQ